MEKILEAIKNVKDNQQKAVELAEQKIDLAGDPMGDINKANGKGDASMREGSAAVNRAIKFYKEASSSYDKVIREATIVKGKAKEIGIKSLEKEMSSVIQTAKKHRGWAEKNISNLKKI